MNKDRLLRLAQLLRDEAAKPHIVTNFDLGMWGYVNPKYRNTPDNGEPFCGSAGCAVGTAIASRIFEAEGLSRYNAKHGQSLIPLYNGREGFDAVEEFFGINRRVAAWLFAYPSYRQEGKSYSGKEGELNVAERIECLVATNGKSIPDWHQR